MFQGLRTAIVHVSDLDAAKDWYCEVLEEEPYFDEPFYVGFNVGGFELGLHPDVEGRVQGHCVVVYWGVEDIEESLDRILELGAELHEEIRNVGDGILVATVFDPFGNLFGLIQNPHFRPG